MEELLKRETFIPENLSLNASWNSLQQGWLSRLGIKKDPTDVNDHIIANDQVLMMKAKRLGKPLQARGWSLDLTLLYTNEKPTHSSTPEQGCTK